MDEPEIRVTVKVTLVSKDGFYTVSEFAPEFWEKYRESAVLIAKADHQEERERRPDELIERGTIPASPAAPRSEPR